MMRLHESEIINIMPINLITPEVRALSYSVGQAMRKMLKYSAAAHLYADLRNIPEEALDLIAIELNTQYYMQTLNRKTKEELITQTLQWYMHGGTPSVLEQFLATILDGGRIDEWYEYGGARYYFRTFVYAGEHEIKLGYGTVIKRQIAKYKNVRSWIEWVALVIASEFNINPQYGNIIRFQNIFHPRKNIAYLKLDGRWKLDGRKALSGYDDEIKADFYPTRLRCSTCTDIKMDHKESMQIQIKARGKPQTDQSIRYQNKAGKNATSRECMTLRICIQESVTSGNIGITNMAKLDGAWKLDDSRKLNGGYYII